MTVRKDSPSTSTHPAKDRVLRPIAGRLPRHESLHQRVQGRDIVGRVRRRGDEGFGRARLVLAKGAWKVQPRRAQYRIPPDPRDRLAGEVAKSHSELIPQMSHHCWRREAAPSRRVVRVETFETTHERNAMPLNEDGTHVRILRVAIPILSLSESPLGSALDTRRESDTEEQPRRWLSSEDRTARRSNSPKTMSRNVSERAATE